MHVTLDADDLRPLVQDITREVLRELAPKLERPAESSQPLLLGAAETAKLLGVSEKTLWNHTQPRGDIPRVEIGNRILYDPADLQAWIERKKHVPQKPEAKTGRVEPAGDGG